MQKADDDKKSRIVALTKRCDDAHVELFSLQQKYRDLEVRLLVCGVDVGPVQESFLHISLLTCFFVRLLQENLQLERKEKEGYKSSFNEDSEEHSPVKQKHEDIVKFRKVYKLICQKDYIDLTSKCGLCMFAV